MKKLLLLIFAIVLNSATAQNVFEKDPTWNTYSLPDGQIHADGSQIVKSDVQPDGKFIVAITDYSSIPSSRLIRMENNILDTSFLTGTFNGIIKDFLIQPDGKVVVSGSFTSYQGVTAKYFVRLNPDGTRDESFNMGTGFTIQNNSTYTWTNAVKIQADGKLIVVGQGITGYNGFACQGIVRINTDGSADTSYTLDPTAYIFGVNVVTVQPDGKILLAGNGRVYRTLTDGTLDPLWVLNAPQVTEPTFSSDYYFDSLNTIVCLPDGKIMVGGRFERLFSGTTRRDLVRLNSDGSIDASFYNQGFRTVTSYRQGVTSIVLLPDGRLIIGGDFTRWHPDATTVLTTPKCILRLNVDGTMDTSFTAILSFSNSYDDTNAITSIQWTPDGKLICTGRINSYNGVAVNNIVRINTDGERDTTFHNICKGFNGLTEHILEQPDGKILVAGKFSMYNGATRDRLVRLNADGSVDQNFVANCYEFVADYNTIYDIAVQADGKILIASSGRYYNDGLGGSLVRLNADGSLDTTFVSLTTGNYGLSGSFNTVIVQPDGKIVAVGGANGFDNSIVRLNPDGSPDPDFLFNDIYVSGGTGVLQPDGKILFSAAVEVGGNNNRLFRLLANGQPDPSFNAQASLPYVTQFSLQPDGKILYFSDMLGGHKVFRLNSDGTQDSGFSFPSTSTFQSPNCAHALLPDGKILMGVRQFAPFTNYLVRRNADGSADTTFDIGAGIGYGYGYGSTITEVVSDIAVDQYGRILVAGAYRLFNEEPENGFVRLRPEGSLETPDVTAENQFMVYPNPTTGILHMNTTSNRIIDKVEIYSISGSRIYSRGYHSSYVSVDVSAMQTGIYFIKIVSADKETKTIRFVKQ